MNNAIADLGAHPSKPQPADAETSGQIQRLVSSSAARDFPALVSPQKMTLLSSRQQPASPLFKLPRELRVIIYRLLLISSNPDGVIKAPGELVAERRSQLVYRDIWSSDLRCRIRSGTNADILGACRDIYEEAIFILYGENIFGFHTPPGIETFRLSGLAMSQGKSSVVLMSSLAEGSKVPTTRSAIFQCLACSQTHWDD